MKGILKLTHILPSLFIGIIIGGAVSGRTDLLLCGLVLLALDVIVGIMLQIIVDGAAYHTEWDIDDEDDVDDRDENGNKTPRKQSLKAVQELNCFTPDVEKSIMKGTTPLTQIYRNFLLSEMYGHKEGLLSYSIILAPQKHPTTKKELESLTNVLRNEYKNKIKQVYLEDFVNAIIINCPDEYREVFERFYDRYLNFDKLKKNE